METIKGCHIKSVSDALVLFEGCRTGVLYASIISNNRKRVPRRLNDEERFRYISSGSVFIWDEAESGIKRYVQAGFNIYSWTDGKAWGPSRISGSFLVYRETVAEKGRGESDTSSINSDYKSDGLIKKTFRIDGTSGKKRHLVSYYTHSDVDNGLLKFPLEFPQLKDIHLSSDVYPDYVVENSRGPQSSSYMGGGGQTSGYHPQQQQQQHPQQQQHQNQQQHQQQQHQQQHQQQGQQQYGQQGQQEERAAAYYYQQQAQQRRFNNSSPLNSARFDGPGSHSARSQSMPNSPHQSYGKRKGGPDDGMPPGLRSSVSQYFTHAPGSSTNASSMDGSSPNSSREGSPHDSPGRSHESPGWSRLQKKFEYPSVPKESRTTLVSPQSQNSNGSPIIAKIGSGGPYSAGSPLSRPAHRLETPTSAVDPSSQNPLTQRPQTPIFSSSLKHELVPMRPKTGEPEEKTVEGWRKLSTAIGHPTMGHPDIRRMSDSVKRRVSLLSPLVVPGKPRENRITSMSTAGSNSVVASPSLSPSKAYIPDMETSRISLPSLSEPGGGPLFLAHSGWKLSSDRVFLSNEKL
jgi:hypothetical protein